MAEFRDPDVGIHKVYTRTGDDGTTGLVDGSRVAKDDLRIEAYGDVDELMAVVGLVRAEATGVDAQRLERVLHQLFNLGSGLATPIEARGEQQPLVTEANIAWLEATMDEINRDLPALTSFVLPGDSRANASLHLARTVCRRAERKAVALHRDGGCTALEVQYLNRLSDLFFVLARDASGGRELLWRPDAAESQ